MATEATTDKTKPKLAPVGLEVGDTFKHKWGELEITNMRGEYEDSEDNREWKIHDPDTGEEAWKDIEFFLRLMNANVR